MTAKLVVGNGFVPAIMVMVYIPTGLHIGQGEIAMKCLHTLFAYKFRIFNRIMDTTNIQTDSTHTLAAIGHF